jgi:enediyne biosynthesis protein E4
VVGVNGYLSQGDARPHFGLGDAEQADAVRIRWPDRTTTDLTTVAADQILVVVQEAP